VHGLPRRFAGRRKIAGLSRLWSEAKYNFAFFDRLPGLDRDALYLAYLPKVRATTSTLQYYETLAEFYAQLHDGHTGVGYPPQVSNLLGYPAVITRLIEGRVFIDVVQDHPGLKEQGIVRGLEVTAIDAIPVKEYGKERVAPHVSASSLQDLDVRTYQWSLLSGPKGSPVEEPTPGRVWFRGVVFSGEPAAGLMRYHHEWASSPQSARFGQSATGFPGDHP